jgi:hypothetical protein
VRADWIRSVFPCVKWVRKNGHLIGWAAVVGIIAGIDATSDKTMTASFRSASRHPVGRPLLILASAYVTGHLFGVIPGEYDVLDVMFGKPSTL